MNSKNIIIGDYYRHKDHPNYAWAKVLKVMPPKTGINTHGYFIVKCEWSVEKGDSFGFIKHFKLSDLVKGD